MKAVSPISVMLAPSTRISIRLLALLAICFALYFGRGLFLPVTLALILALTFSPFLRWGRRVKLPAYLLAMSLVIALAASIAVTVNSLATPVANLVADAPKIGQQLKWKLKSLREPLASIDKVGEEVEKIAAESRSGGVQEVVIKQPSLVARATDDVLAIAATFVLTLTLCFFLLVSRDLFYGKVVRVMPTLSDKKMAVQLVTEIEQDVSRYLLTVAAINVCLGACVGAAFWIMGMPNPLMWAVAAGLLNFLPYVGAIGGLLLSAGVAVISFDTLGQALAIPAIYLALTVIEGQFITPYLLGRRFSLNTVVILLSIAFWGFMWGAVGVFVAVPILIILKVFCERVEGLRSVGEFISGEPDLETAKASRPRSAGEHG